MAWHSATPVMAFVSSLRTPSHPGFKPGGSRGVLIKATQQRAAQPSGVWGRGMGRSYSPVGVHSQMSLAQLSFQLPASTGIRAKLFLGVGSPDLATALGCVTLRVPGFPSEQLQVRCHLQSHLRSPLASRPRLCFKRGLIGLGVLGGVP